MSLTGGYLSQGFAPDLDIEGFQFSRTHWSVKGADLYRALLKNSQPRRPRPKVFQLAECENMEPGLVSAMMRQMLLCGILRLPAEHPLQMFDDRMKGARRVKRRAADRHPNAILAGRLP